MQNLKTWAIFVSQEFQGIRGSKINDKTTDMLVGTPVPGPSPILTGSMDMESQLLNDNVSIVARCPEIPVGGRLTHFLTEWESITSDKWVLDLIQEGYKLEFIRKPSFRGIKETVVPSCQTMLLEKEIENLLSKNAIEKSSEKGYYERLLQYSFSGSKEKREDETCNKSSTSQQVCSEETFQNGLYEKSHTISRKRRLVNNSRYSRCLLSSKNIQAPSPTPSFQFQGQGVSVPSSKFRSYSGAKSFLKGHISSSSLFKTTEYSSCNISGRLVSPQSNQKVTFAKSIHRSKSPLSTRLHNKQRKVKFTTKSGSYIHRGSFSVSRMSGIPYSGEGARTESISSTSSSGLQHSTRLFSSSGKDSILSRNDSECKIVHAPNPITFVTKLESNKNVYGLQNSCSTIAKATFEMVVTGSKYFKGSVCSTNSVYGDSDDRCQSGWLGRSHEQSYSSGSLVKCAENVSHQFLEMEAVYLTVKHFLPYLINKNVLIQTDNSTVTCYLNLQGGTKSLQLWHLTWKLWSLVLENNIYLKSVHIAGKKNFLADTLSRQGSVLQTEWSMNNSVVSRIFHLWDCPMMDLFATFPRYIDAKEPIREKLLFLSPIRSRKGAYQPKTRHGERRYFKSGPILDYLRCK